MSAEFSVVRNVRVPMRDGVELAADIWLPSGAERAPVLLTRTPYGRTIMGQMTPPTELARAGFAVILQDCRGRFDSDGEWTYVHSEVDDGYDTVEWAAAQLWSNGRVGMFGGSYMGVTQWTAAIKRPPHLAAIAPECCSADYWVASFDSGGAFRLSLRLGWTASVVASMAATWGIDDPKLRELLKTTTALRAAVVSADPAAIEQARLNAKELMEEVYRTRPMRNNPLWHGRATWLDEIFDHERRDDANWRRINPSSHYDALDLPALHIGGWYDLFLEGTLGTYMGMRRQAPTERARENQRLIIGPWAHWTPMTSVVGEVDFGPAAVLDLNQERIAWHGHWLADRPAPSTAPVRLFVMGENVWRDEQEWPLARTQFTPWHLREGGGLGPETPSDGEAPDRFTYDPRDPVPTLGGKLLGSGEVAGPFDQRPNEGRADVLVYTSPPLEQPMELTGPVKLELWAATDAPDTDFTAILIDVHPDGVARNLCEGAVRARHAGIPMPLAAGATYHFTVDLVATSIVLAAGHRLRLHVSSSSFPEWEPNPNTGAPLGASTDADIAEARQTIFHDRARPSRLILPVIPRD
ncbi:CocE/NonD family hydrolase [uncultured Phenylobacterium sp.]|uniref:CocE/NonD family hydrolase n=1 Tax=uncultured Phenylobacterium sp. TaxID=349273 RepID=UPI0025FBB457|nr:CocE/NonD family hydrolase [uncultured Phenylobacterium sp.]